jgi:hypothetical protein
MDTKWHAGPGFPGHYIEYQEEEKRRKGQFTEYFEKRREGTPGTHVEQILNAFGNIYEI